MPAATITRTRKSQPATIRIINLDAGLYRALSSDGVSWYTVNVYEGTCTCTAAAYGRLCRHRRAVEIVWYLHRSLRMGRQQQVRLSGAAPAPTRLPHAANVTQVCPACGATRWGKVVAEGWCSCQKPATAPVQGWTVAALDNPLAAAFAS